MRRFVAPIICLFGCGVLLSCFLVFRSGQNAVQAPDIIFLMIDTLRADKLGLYGASPEVSPEIDQLGSAGVVFEQVVSQASWTRPSVASILTGVYPRKLGVMKEEWDVLGPEAITLAEAFQRNGYTTIGLTANPQLNTVFGFSQGFDRYTDSTVIFSWMKDEEGKKKADRSARVKMAREVFDQALEQLRQPRQGPVFLQLMVMDVHAHARIRADAVDTRFQTDSDGKYLQAVKNVSAEVGRFVQALQNDSSLGLRNTILVITSDHGEGLHDHPDVKNSRGHGNLLYRSQIHVPLIFYGWGKGAFDPGRRPAMIESIDIFPTLLSLAGIEGAASADGQSQKQVLLFNNPPDESRIAFSETRWHSNVEKVAVADAKWIYIESRDDWPGTDSQELQSFGAPQNGKGTSKAASEREVVARLHLALEARERELNSAAAPIKPEAAISSRELKQLKSLGYLGK